MTKNKIMGDVLVALALAAAIIIAITAIATQSARADGGAPPPPQHAPPNGFRQGVYPQPVPQQGSPSCLMTALQLGYLTGRRELAYSASEACMYFAGSSGAHLPYGYYGPYVPSGWVPPGWALPMPGY